MALAPLRALRYIDLGTKLWDAKRMSGTGLQKLAYFLLLALMLYVTVSGAF